MSWNTGLTTRVLEALGIGLGQGDKLPDAGIPERVVCGLHVYILPRNPKGERKHRIMVHCACGEHVPVGRMHQHVKGRFHKVMTAPINEGDNVGTEG